MKFISSYWESNEALEAKNTFIESNTEIYFPAIDLTPVQWLEEVLKKIKQKLDI